MYFYFYFFHVIETESVVLQNVPPSGWPVNFPAVSFNMFLCPLGFLQMEASSTTLVLVQYFWQERFIGGSL